MALQGPIPVPFGLVFPYGAFAVGAVEPVHDFDRSTAARKVQESDKTTGEPVWSVVVLDADPAARPSSKTVKVKISAPVMPSLPEPAAGVPFVPVEFEGLAVVPWVNDSNGTGRLAYSFRAKGIKAPGRTPRVRRAGPTGQLRARMPRDGAEGPDVGAVSAGRGRVGSGAAGLRLADATSPRPQPSNYGRPRRLARSAPSAGCWPSRTSGG